MLVSALRAMAIGACAALAAAPAAADETVRLTGSQVTVRGEAAGPSDRCPAHQA